MKRAVYVALVAMFLFAGMVPVVSAGVGNDLQKASYLNWPKIVVNSAQDTVITIFNDSATSTFLHCYWMDEYQNPANFEWEITRFQTVWFRASDGSGMDDDGQGRFNVAVPGFEGTVGELKCWAVVGNEDSPNYDKPTKKNALTGTATIYNFAEGTAVGYNAYGFKKIAAGAAAAAELKLDGVDYDECPQYLLGTFMLDGASFTDDGYLIEAGTTELTLAPCKQDLRQDREAIFAKVNLTVYDEDEVGFTNAYICFKCWVETTLEETPTVSGGYSYTNLFVNFTAAQVGGVFATVKVEPKAGTDAACDFPEGVSTSAAVPVIGLLFGSQTITPVDPLGVPTGPALWASAGSIMHQTSTPSPITGVSVLYDLAGSVVDASKR